MSLFQTFVMGMSLTVLFGCRSLDVDITDSYDFEYGKDESDAKLIYISVNKRFPVWAKKSRKKIINNLYNVATKMYPQGEIVATNTFSRKQIEWNEIGYELTVLIDND